MGRGPLVGNAPGRQPKRCGRKGFTKGVVPFTKEFRFSLVKNALAIQQCVFFTMSCRGEGVRWVFSKEFLWL